MDKKTLIRSLKAQKFPDNIIKAFEKVKRENFIPKPLKERAYEDIPLHIGYSQTISQPYTIAFMLTLLELRNKQKILEIGSGSGYVLALINEISKNSEIYGVERIKNLFEQSKKVLPKNITIINKNGAKGLKEKALFDRILVSAAFEEVPNHLVRQLKVGGILVAPVRNSIIFIQHFPTQNKVQEFYGFRFVPIV